MSVVAGGFSVSESLGGLFLKVHFVLAVMLRGVQFPRARQPGGASSFGLKVQTTFPGDW